MSDMPHIGHAHTEFADDAPARWHRQGGDDTERLIGLDAHGQKILRSAAPNDTTPKKRVDALVANASPRC